MARMLEQQERERINNNKNQYPYNFNRPGPGGLPGPVQGQNDGMDEELKRAIEQSKKEFYK